MRANFLPLLLAALAPAFANPTSTLHTKSINLAAGQEQSQFTVEISVTGLPTGKDEIKTMPRLSDVSSAAFPATTVKVAGPIDPLPTPGPNTSATWRFQVEVSGFPKTDTQARKFLFAHGPIREEHDYTISNIAGRTFTWSAKSAAEWNLSSPTKALAIALNIGDLAATSVRLHTADFQNAEKIGLSQADFDLCASIPTNPANCELPSTFARRSSHTLYLIPKKDPPSGLYKGKASIVAAEKAEAEDLALTTIYAPGNPIWGWLLLALGVGIAFLAQVVLRHWAHRAEEKRLVALFRVRIAELKSTFEKFKAPVKEGAQQWLNDLNRLDNDLSDAKLKPLFRPLLPQPFEKEVTAVEDFKSHLEQATARFKHLKTLLFDGLERVDSYAKDFPGKESEVKEAARKIAELFATADLAANIVKILADLRTALNAPELVVLRGALPQDDLRSATLQILASSFLSWIFWGIVAIFSGAFLLILVNPAFGTPLDLLKCFAWGLGVSVGGQQAPQNGPVAVAASIGIKFPGAKA